MKKFCPICLVLCFIFLLTSGALAAQARSIETDADSTFHARHLLLHLNSTDCHATGNYIKIRTQANGNNVIGHLEQADEFLLLDIKENWAKIEITGSDKTSPDSQIGMTGWVNADYIDCDCSETAYFASSSDNAVTALTNLADYIGTTSVRCIGNNLRVRNSPNGDQIIGHLEKADEFLLLALQDGWAQICVTCAASTSPDSWKGLSGWVSTDYIEIKPNAQVPASDAWSGYSSVLDFFYQAIMEHWDLQKIIASGFVEPYDFPHSLENDGFILRDINSDGTNELIILSRGYSIPGSENCIAAIYTQINGQPIRVLESWTRSRNYLCSDGSIYNVGSNGASYAVNYIFDLVDGQIVVREGVLSGDCEENGEMKNRWFWVDERADFTYAEYPSLSDEEAEARIALYQSMVTHQINDFIPFSQYK